MRVDPQTLATGYRSSKIVGSPVSNENNETVGTIDDLIITPGGQAPYAILSVGGFFGPRHEICRTAFHVSKDRRQESRPSWRHERRLYRAFPTSNTIPTAEIAVARVKEQGPATPPEAPLKGRGLSSYCWLRGTHAQVDTGRPFAASPARKARRATPIRAGLALPPHYRAPADQNPTLDPDITLAQYRNDHGACSRCTAAIERVRVVWPRRHMPLKRPFRFSTKARLASFASSEFCRMPPAFEVRTIVVFSKCIVRARRA